MDFDMEENAGLFRGAIAVLVLLVIGYFLVAPYLGSIPTANNTSTIPGGSNGNSNASFISYTKATNSMLSITELGVPSSFIVGGGNFSSVSPQYACNTTTGEFFTYTDPHAFAGTNLSDVNNTYAFYVYEKFYYYNSSSAVSQFAGPCFSLANYQKYATQSSMQNPSGLGDAVLYKLDNLTASGMNLTGTSDLAALGPLSAYRLSFIKHNVMVVVGMMGQMGALNATELTTLATQIYGKMS